MERARKKNRERKTRATQMQTICTLNVQSIQLRIYSIHFISINVSNSRRLRSISNIQDVYFVKTLNAIIESLLFDRFTYLSHVKIHIFIFIVQTLRRITIAYDYLLFAGWTTPFYFTRQNTDVGNMINEPNDVIIPMNYYQS